MSCKDVQLEREKENGAEKISDGKSITHPPQSQRVCSPPHQIGRTDGARDNEMDAHIYSHSGSSSPLPRVHADESSVDGSI